jgi:hypothetical protein
MTSDDFSKKLPLPYLDEKGEPCPYGSVKNCVYKDCENRNCLVYKDYQARVKAYLARKRSRVNETKTVA